jgi:hypothetical protein
MADEDQNGNGRAEPIEANPEERATEFSEWLGVPASRFGIAVERALEHFHDASSDSPAHGWVPIGPRNVGGAIRALAQHPSQRNWFFAGSSQGGLWKSEDNGYSWRPIGAPTMTVPVGAIAIAPSNPQVMYVGTGESASGPGGTGIYKSEDGGNSFSKIAGNASSGDNGGANHYARLVVDPLESHRMWAATDTGLWRLDPSGVLGIGGGFTRESLPGAAGVVSDVALARDPHDADKYVLVAAISGRGIFRAVFSRSAGKTGDWKPVIGGGPAGAIALPAPGQIGRIRLAFSGTKAGVAGTPFAYAIMEDQGVMGRVPAVPGPGKSRLGYPTFVYRSQDLGQTWFADAGSTAIEPPSSDKAGQAFYSLQIAVDPNDPEHVLAGYVNLHRSTDRGKTFTEMLDWALYDHGDRGQHGDQHAIVFDLRSSRQVWIGNDGGISFTADYMTLAAPSIPGIVHAPTAQWRKRSYGIGAAQFTAITTHPRFPFICGGGMQDNGTFISYGGPTWYRLDGGDGGQMAFHPSDPRQYFTTSQVSIDAVQLIGAGSIVIATIGAGGSGYVLNDTGTINGGNADATYKVTGVGGGGAVTSFTVTTPGTKYMVANGVATTDAGAQPGAGVGFTVNIAAVLIVPPFPLYSATLPDVDPPGNVMMSRHSGIGFPAANDSVFVGIVEADPAPAHPGRLLIGRKLAGFYTVDAGTTVAPFTPALAGDEVSAMAFALGGNDVWVGSKAGLLYTSAGAALAAPPASTGLTPRALPVAGRVNAIVVHPQNVNVVAVAITVGGGGTGHVYLSQDGGQHWAIIDGSGSSLPPGPILSVAFDPGNTQVIFAGTMAGVWVARNLPARPVGAANLGANFDAEWKTYSSGLPPVQVNDLEVTPIKNTLRCATFGRGAFEAELPATPAAFHIPEVRLMIRSNPIDDSYVRDRPGGNPIYPNLFFDDPRPPAAPAPPADFDYTRALDIRVDAPGFVRSEAFAFGEEIDGVEFDETLVSDKPLAGDINHVYVQVHNRGFGAAANVKVSLYFAKADHVPAPAGPLTAPDIDNRINYPGEPAADSLWQLAAPPQTLGALAPGEPSVLRFEWTAPLELTDGVALMAVCSNDKDQLAAIAPAAIKATDFVKAERRAALRITAVNRDTVYIRDGADDEARPGGVAWGGHSPDLIVVQAAVANPDDPAGPFKDLDDQRSSDAVKPGANFIYVRVFNRTRVAVNAKVKVYSLPLFDLARTSAWTQLPAGAPLEVVVNAIAPNGWKFATFNWNGVTDPDPANTSAYKGFVLLAMAGVVDAAGAELDPYPDLAQVTDLESFWRFFKGAPLANNAAVRALRFQS